MEIRLWNVLGEWSDWQALTGETMTREQYEAKITEAAAEAHEHGHDVFVVQMSADDMRLALEAGGWPNTQEGRAAVLAGGVADRLAIKVGSDHTFTGTAREAVGSAWIPGNVHGQATEPIGEDGVAGAVRRILKRGPRSS